MLRHIELQKFRPDANLRFETVLRTKLLDIDPLTELTIQLSRQSTSDDKKLNAICYCIERSIKQANRISLWRFVQQRNAIECIVHLERGAQLSAKGAVIARDDFPNYFEALLQSDTVIASDARNHPATSCFNEGYFVPNNIYSLLDFIYHDNFEPIGVICCESVGQQVEWTDAEVAIIRRIASITSMFY